METKTFLNYLAESKKNYSYTVKLAMPSVTDNTLDCLEACLSKYHLVSAEKFKSTPIQESPLDFPSVKNMPVHTAEIELEYPSSTAFLQNLIANSLSVPNIQVVVFSQNDPLKIERDLFTQRTSDEYKSNYQPVLGSDYPKDQDQQQFGNDYTASFLKSLADQRSNRPLNTLTNALIPDQKVDTVSKEYHSYNTVTGADQPTLFGRTKLIKIKGK